MNLFAEKGAGFITKQVSCDHGYSLKTKQGVRASVIYFGSTMIIDYYPDFVNFLSNYN